MLSFFAFQFASEQVTGNHNPVKSSSRWSVSAVQKCLSKLLAYSLDGKMCFAGFLGHLSNHSWLVDSNALHLHYYYAMCL